MQTAEPSIAPQHPDGGTNGNDGSTCPDAILSIDVGRKNLALCLLRAGDCPKGTRDHIVEWIVTTCDPTPAGMAVALNKLPWCVQCSEVVVERQPPRNPTMTRLQHYVEMYFVLRDKAVTVQDAKHKLAFAAGTPWWEADPEAGWSYHTRKKLSVVTARNFLGGTRQDATWVDLFAASTKKDDLADALLQGQAFCHHVRPLELSKRAMTPKRPKPRRPTAAQVASGKFSKPNLAHFVRGCSTAADAERALRQHGALKSAQRQYGSVEAALADLAA
jgi:hypothetical protein